MSQCLIKLCNHISLAFHVLANISCTLFLWRMRFQQYLSTISSYIDINVLHIHDLNLMHNLFWSSRGEAVCLLHVWQAFFPTLPPPETQPHSYGYEPSLLTLCIVLDLTTPMHSLALLPTCQCLSIYFLIFLKLGFHTNKIINGTDCEHGETSKYFFKGFWLSIIKQLAAMP